MTEMFSRFLGTVVTMRTREAYGFIRSDQVDTDIFFGLNHCTPELRKEAKNLVNKAVIFSVQHHQVKMAVSKCPQHRQCRSPGQEVPGGEEGGVPAGGLAGQEAAGQGHGLGGAGGLPASG